MELFRTGNCYLNVASSELPLTFPAHPCDFGTQSGHKTAFCGTTRAYGPVHIYELYIIDIVSARTVTLYPGDTLNFTTTMLS